MNVIMMKRTKKNASWLFASSSVREMSPNCLWNASFATSCTTVPMSERDEQLVRLELVRHRREVLEERLVRRLAVRAHLEQVRRREEVLVHVGARRDVARVERVEHGAEVDGAPHADRRAHERVHRQIDPVRERGEVRENARLGVSVRVDHLPNLDQNKVYEHDQERDLNAEADLRARHERERGARRVRAKQNAPRARRARARTQSASV